MNVKDIVDQMDLKVFCGEDFLGNEVTGGYVSDLLSDVMGNASEGEVWITLQSHLNVVAIASLKELAAIILVKNIQPDKQVMMKAVEENIPVLGSSEPTFNVSGKLFNMLVQK